MRVLPILFNADMVRAMLDGRKKVARRVVKPQIPDHCPNCMHMHNDFIYDLNTQNVYCASCGEPLERYGIPYKAPYHPGDVLYVRETWGHGYEEGTYIYKADDKLVELPTFKETTKMLYKPSIHMPKEAARIWLKVTDVKVERLQEITIEDIQAEGLSSMAVHAGDMEIALQEWKILWDSTIKKSDHDCYSWDANPWVWVIEFERCEKSDGNKAPELPEWKENFMRRFSKVN